MQQGDGMSAENSATTGRRRWMYAGAAALAGLAGAGLAWWRLMPGKVNETELPALWGLEFTTPQGEQLSMASLRGYPLLLNFWATWCPPCIEEMPMLDAFFRENSSKGWRVLGLAVDKPAPVLDFLARHPVNYPVAMAGMDGLSLSSSLGNNVGGLPFTVVLAADGSVRERKIGKLSSQDLTRWRELK